MKKAVTPVLLLFLFYLSAAQDSIKAPVKKYYNELGVDATGFIRETIRIASQNNYYLPTYYLTYRRHIKRSNFRFGIGGDFFSNDIPAAFAGDMNKYHRRSWAFNIRIGYEFYNDIGKRWQVFYGLDFKPGVSYLKNDVPFWNGGYANGIEAKSQTYGAGPVLGFRFKINQRISIATEASFTIYYEQQSEQRYYIPVDASFPAKPADPLRKTRGVHSSFAQPLAIFFLFDI